MLKKKSLLEKIAQFYRKNKKSILNSGDLRVIYVDASGSEPRVIKIR